MRIDVTVWCCPSCGSYAAGSSFGDLRSVDNKRTAMQNLATEDPKNWGRSIGTRDICQRCRQNGSEVHRIPVMVAIDLAEDGSGVSLVPIDVGGQNRVVALVA